MTVSRKDFQLLAECASRTITALELKGASLHRFLYEQFQLGRKLSPAFSPDKFTTALVNHMTLHGHAKAAKRTSNATRKGA